LKRTPFFLGEHELILDPKNRISVPSIIRKSLDPTDDGSLFVTIKGSILCLYTLGHFRRITKKQLAPGVMPDELLRKYTYLTLSLGAETEVDAQGRIVLPDSLLNRVGLGRDPKNPNAGREVTLAGVNDCMQLFPRAKWTEHREKLIAQSEVIEQWAEASLRQSAPQKPIAPPAQGMMNQ